MIFSLFRSLSHRSETPMREDPRRGRASRWARVCLRAASVSGRSSHRRAVFARSGSTIKEAVRGPARASRVWRRS